MSNPIENSVDNKETNTNSTISDIEKGEESFEAIKQKADQGDSEAQAEIGIKYYDGKSVETDYAEALKYFKLSADQGNKRGQLWLGKMYCEGKGLEKPNYEEALKYSKLSAEQGNSEALSNIGLMYRDGLGVTQDYEEAYKYFKQSAEQNNDDGQLYLGLMYCNGEFVTQNYEKAIKYFKLSAEQGNSNAQCNLGILFRDGKGTAQDYEEAFKYFNLSAEQGNQIAQFDLGKMYVLGEGIPKDIDKGFKFIKLSSDQGNAVAQLNMGLFYRDGYSVAKNPNEAFKYFKLSADQGNANAQYCLGDMYLEGNGVEKNYKEAFKYFSLSAEKNNALAQKELGMMYRDGKGVSKDLDKAKKYLKLSADQGNKEAKLTLYILPFIRLIIFPFAIIILSIIKGFQYILLNVFPYIVKPIDKFHIFFRKEEKTESTPKKKKKKKKDKTKSSEQNISSESEESNGSKDNSFQKSKPLLLNEVIRNLLNGCRVDENGCWVNARCALNEYWVSCFVLFFSFLLLELFFYSFGLMIGHGIEYYKINLTEANTELLTVLFIIALLAPCLLVFGWTIDLVHRRLNDIGMPIKIQKWLIPIDFFIGLFVPGQVEENEFGKPRKYHIDIKKLFNSLFVKKRKKLSKEKRIAQVMEIGLNKKAARVEIFLRDNLLYIIVTFIVGLTTYIYYSNNEQKEIKPVAKKVVIQNNTKPTSEKVSTQNTTIPTTTDIDLIKGMIRERNYIEAANRLKVLVDQGNKEAEKLLVAIGRIFVYGKDFDDKTIETNFSEAAKNFKFLAERGNTDAQQMLLGIVIFWIEGKNPEGKIVKTNFAEATNCLQFLADKGNKETQIHAINAIFGLGFSLCLGDNFFEKGKKMEKDFPEGIKLIKIANSYNTPDVQKMMKDIYNNADKGNHDAQKIVRALNNESITDKEKIYSCEYQVKDNFIFIELNSSHNDYSYSAAKVVGDFYSDYLNHNCSIDNWKTNKKLTPLTRQIFLMLKHTDFDYLDYDFIVQGQDYGNIWKITNVQVRGNTALVDVENSFDGKGARNIKIHCKYVNGKWFIDDIEESKKLFYSFLNANLTLGVVNSYELPIFSKKYTQQNLPFYDIKNRIIPLKFNSLDYYQIDSSNNLDNKIDSRLSDSEWLVKSESVITFNFLNKISKGESKYLAYIVLGEPAEDSSNKLFYSPNDYISYDNDGKITSWTGFEDFKDFFTDGTSSNNQIIGYVNAKSGINLRKEPSTKAEKVCGLAFNTKVMILDTNGPQATFEKITSNWYLITDGTKVGWAFGGFIRKE